MKTHRPWQPHMGNTPLFNPYTPAGHATTLDHFDLIEEEEEIEGSEGSGEGSDEAGDPPSKTKRD
jgi:hypothetical protein